ncbi:TNF receptor-associated factor family protein DDB_G0272098-like [Condylostylus longicornis]|uniref:TNF receptor-associated factor family protein DDB_G0272098-like n=1 Tax=Condylostylus longicornis TaxID=2530218 RepID=UPI00244DBB6C|nr:TNF receptor-associated factor family protein DDB_G0272098-like [Condylostylus longicornis]
MIIKLLVICTLVTFTLAKPPFEGYEPKRNYDSKLGLNEDRQCDCKCPTVSNSRYNEDQSSSDSRQRYDYRKPQSSKSLSSESGESLSSSSKSQFYTYTPPKDTVTDSKSETEETITNRKKIRVLFIRAPESHSVENLASKLAKSVVEDQTHVYVLTKQTDSKELQKAFEKTIEIKSNKPEIHFVNFRNEQDARDAQQRIQQEIDGQYDGASSNIEGGEASLQSWSSTDTETTSNQENDDDDNGDGSNGILSSEGDDDSTDTESDNADNIDERSYQNNDDSPRTQSRLQGNSNNNEDLDSLSINRNGGISNRNKNRNQNDSKYNLASRNGYLPPVRN